MDITKFLPETVQTFALSTIGLYIVVNPSGVSSVFVGLTKELTRAERVWIALRAVIAAAVILAVFAVTGTFIFDKLEISAAALQIAGGIFIFGVAFALARGKENEFFGKLGDATQTDHKSIAFTPLAVPLIAGPASITVVITASAKAQADDPYAWALLIAPLIGSIVIVCALCLLSMWRLIRLVERRGSVALILPRIMGLVLAVIAVQFIIQGIEMILPRFAAALEPKP